MRVVVLGTIFDPGTKLLRAACDLQECGNEALSPQGLADADAVIVGTQLLRSELINALPRLKVIGRIGVGYDNIDVAAATARGIPVVYTPGVMAQSVAEQTFSLILALARRTFFWHQELLSGHWENRGRQRSVNLSGKTLGIVGLGRIGSKVAALGRAFGMTVVGHDPVLGTDQFAALGVEPLTLEEVLRRAHVISIHVPLDSSTTKLIGRRELAWVRPGALLVNTARGAVLDLEAVCEALQQGRLGGVGLDVFPVEPPDIAHPIFRHPNFVGSPHVSSHTETLDEMGLVAAQGVLDALEGRRPQFIVNPQVWQEPARR